MKKLIGTVAVAALLATAAFAEGISFGSWGRALWIVGTAQEAGEGDNTITSWLGQSWGGPSPRVGLSVSGSSDNMGFNVDFHANGNEGIALGDNCLVWTKPIEMLKIIFAGKNDQNILRGDSCFGLWNWDRIGAVGVEGEEGWTFPAILNRNVTIVATPIEGLTVGAGVDCLMGSWGGLNPDEAADERFVDQLGRKSAIAAAYSISNIGTAKIGFRGLGKGYDKEGGYNADRKDAFEFDAAFEFTMLEKVFIAAGVRLPLGGTFGEATDLYEDGDLYAWNTKPVMVTLHSRLSLIDNLTINVLAGLKLNSADLGATPADFKASGAFGFRFGGEVEYSFSNGLGVFAEVEYANGIWMKSSSADNKDTLTFGLGATKGFSNGVIGVAFEGTTNNYGRQTLKNADDFAWEVPFKMEYWF